MCHWLPYTHLTDKCSTTASHTGGTTQILRVWGGLCVCGGGVMIRRWLVESATM